MCMIGHPLDFVNLDTEVNCHEPDASHEPRYDHAVHENGHESMKQAVQNLGAGLGSISGGISLRKKPKRATCVNCSKTCRAKHWLAKRA